MTRRSDEGKKKKKGEAGGAARHGARHKPLLGKPNLQGTQNAEAILRTYHRSRLRPPSPSPSPSRPPPGLSTLSTEERRGGWRDREGSSRISLCILLYRYSHCPLIPLVLLGHSPLHLTSSPLSCLRHENGRLGAHLETTGGLLKNALAPSAVLLTVPPRPNLSFSLFLSRESVSDLENPDHAPGRDSNRYPRIHRI